VPVDVGGEVDNSEVVEIIFMDARPTGGGGNGFFTIPPTVVTAGEEFCRIIGAID
jgi:hypothetical protein